MKWVGHGFVAKDRKTQTDTDGRLRVTSEWRESEEVEEEEGSRMVFFGQLREPELYSWSAPLLALRDEGQEQQMMMTMMKKKIIGELLLNINMVELQLITSHTALRYYSATKPVRIKRLHL